MTTTATAPLIETWISGRAAALRPCGGAQPRAGATAGSRSAVVARIHLQAARLWMKRVPWFRKPAPPVQTATPGMPAVDVRHSITRTL